MTYFIQDNYNIYDSLPCSAIVFSINGKLDIIYSNKMYDKQFGGKGVKVADDDRKIFDEVIASASEPAEVKFSSEDAMGRAVEVRAFAIKISDDKAFAILIDDNENASTIRTLNRVCTQYATAIRGTDEIFYEYVKSHDEVTIFFPAKDGTMEQKVLCNFFADMGANKFILEEDLHVIKALEDDVKVEKHFEFRMRLREDKGYEWYSVTAKPDKDNTGMFVGTARNIQKQKTEEEHLKEKVLIDPLSKVYNRAAAIERIEERLCMRLEDCACALIVLDIDNFKRINDTYGHMYGDAVIAMAAGSIKATLDEGDIMGRFGGDEFFVFIDNVEAEELEKKLENIRQSVLKMRLDANDENDISCSIGVALGKGGDEYDELFRQADSALYKAKENGKNRFEYFDGTYTDEGAISYTARQNEDESNEAHNVTAIALEIAAKSTNAENAIINIMRHIGMAMELDNIQLLKYDTIEDKVDLEFEWIKERNGEYNVAVTHKRTGYYNHNDLIIYKNRFSKEKIFEHTIDFEEGFSQKYLDVFANTRNSTYLYSTNMETENVFYAMTLRSHNLERKWTKQEIHDISEITKIMSMYLKSTFVETEREKMLIKRLDYDNTGLYTLEKFYDEAGRIGREARAEGGKLGLIHFDVNDLYTFNQVHGGTDGDKIIDGFAGVLKAVGRTRALSCRINGTDIFITLFHTTKTDGEEIAKIIEDELEKFCAQLGDYKEPKAIIKAGLVLFEPGWRLGNQIENAKYVKKNQSIDRCRCFYMKYN